MHVRSTDARARGGGGPSRGFTVNAAPGAAAAAVMPGVRSTPGQPRGRDAWGVKLHPGPMWLTATRSNYRMLHVTVPPKHEKHSKDWWDNKPAQSIGGADQLADASRASPSMSLQWASCSVVGGC